MEKNNRGGKAFADNVRRIVKSIKKHPTEIIAVLALTLSAISICIDYFQHIDISKQSFLQQAVTNAPRLWPHNIRETLQFEMVIHGLEYDTLDNIINISSNVSLVGNLVFVNVGNSMAQVRAHGAMDSLTGGAAIRRILMDEDKRNKLIKLMPDESFFKYEAVPPNDSTSFDVNLPITGFDGDSTTVIHFYVLYENELGALFDTYCWLKLRKKFLEVDIDKKMVYKGKVYHFNLANTKAVEIESENADYCVYSADQANDIKQWAEKRLQRLRK